MASFKNLISTTSAQIASGGTITGDLVINGDLQVDGGGSLSFDEIVQGTQVIDVTNTEALLVRKNDDGGDVFIVDTTNSGVGINTSAGGWSLNVKGADANVFKVQASDGNTLTYLQGTNGDATQRWFADGNATKVLINTNGDSYFTGGNVGIGTASPDYQLELEKAGGGFLSFKTTDTEIVNNDVLGTIQFGADDATASGIDIGAKIVATATDNFQSASSNVDAPTKLEFFTQDNTTTDVMSTVGATLTLGGDDQNATFAGKVAILSDFTGGELLGVKGSVGSDWGARIENTSSTGAGALIKSATTNAGVQLFQVRSGSDNVFTIMGDQKATFAGDVTVSSATDTKPILKLEQTGNNVNGGQFIFLTSGTANDNDLSGVIRFKGMNDAGTPEEIEYATIYAKNTDVSDGSEDGELHFRTMSAGSLDSRLTLNSSNVGIGTTSPGARLEVKGADGSNSTENTTLTDSSGNHLFTQLNGGKAYFQYGPVGIGTTSPSGILSIFRNDSSTVGTNDVVIENDGNGDASLKFSLTGATDWYAYVDNSDSDKFKIRRSTTDHLSIDESGNATFAGGVTIASGGSTDNLYLANTSYGLKITNSTGVIDFISNGSTRMSIANGGGVTVASSLMINSSSANYADLTVGGTGDIVALRASSGTAGFTMYEAGTGRFNMTTLNGSNGIAFKTPSTTRMIIDDNSRISLSNNDSGGTGGEDSTTGNTIFGYGAGGTIDDGTFNNTFIGHKSGNGSKNDATYNTAVGQNSLFALTSGGRNTAMGSRALLQLTSGNYNTTLGYFSGIGITTGNNNIHIGALAGEGNNGASYLVGIGDDTFRVGSVTSGANGAVAVGYQALRVLTSGGSNTAVGYQTGNDITIGSNNTILGYQAGATGTHDITGGSNNTLIGYQAKTNNANASNQTVIGASASAIGNNSVSIGNSSVTTVYMGANAVGATTAVIYAAGFNFPDTQVASSDANTLDDYEEGTWTPTYACSSGSFNTLTMDIISATYTKIGRQVTVRADIRTDSVNLTGASGTLQLTGLPFTVDEDAILIVGQAYNWVSNNFPFSGRLLDGTTNILLIQRDTSNGATSSMVPADLTAGVTADQNGLAIAATYFV